MRTNWFEGKPSACMHVKNQKDTLFTKGSLISKCLTPNLPPPALTRAMIFDNASLWCSNACLWGPNSWRNGFFILADLSTSKKMEAVSPFYILLYHLICLSFVPGWIYNWTGEILLIYRYIYILYCERKSKSNIVTTCWMGNGFTKWCDTFTLITIVQ